MLKDALKTFIKTLLNLKDDVQVFHGCNRCPHNYASTSLGTDDKYKAFCLIYGFFISF